MSSAAAQTYLTSEEYLTWERKAEFKSEYLQGHIVAMSGASYQHTLIAANTIAEIHSQLRGGECTVHTSDMRVKTHATDSYFYPDVVVVCNEPLFEDDVFDTLLNPTLLVEVLSPSTATYDRGEKFEHYKQLAALKEYILVSQDEVRVEHYLRRGMQWALTEYCSLEDVLTLPSIDCGFVLKEYLRACQF